MELFIDDVVLSLIVVLSSLAFTIALAFFLVYKVYADYFKPLRIQATPYTRKLFINDAFWSILNVSGAVVVIVALFHLWANGSIVFNTESPSVFNLVFEFALVFFLFDITYYFLHLGLHKEPFYSLVHIHHHRTFNPNFLTAFAFHPAEGIFAGMIIVFWIWALNLHAHTIFTVLAFQNCMNFSVHFAHEYFPKGWMDKWYTKWFITPTFHDLHHSRVNNNFGGFTTIPDVMFGTITPDLKKVFDSIKDRKVAQEQRDLDEGAINIQTQFLGAGKDKSELEKITVGKNKTQTG